MPLPLAPIAAVALRYGTVAVLAYSAARKIHKAPIRQVDEDALDSVEEGVGANFSRVRSQMNTTARWRRILRLKGGAGVEIDAAALGRIRVRKVN